MELKHIAAAAFLTLTASAAQAQQLTFDGSFFGDYDLQEYKFDVLSDSSVSIWSDTLTDGLDNRLSLFKLNVGSGEYEWNTDYVIANAAEPGFNEVLGYNTTGVNEFGVAIKNGYIPADMNNQGLSDAGGTLNLTQGSYLLVNTFENYQTQAEYDGISGETYSLGFLDVNSVYGPGAFPSWSAYPYGDHSQPHAYQLFVSGDVAPVPVPGAVWLFGSALIGMTAASRRKQA